MDNTQVKQDIDNVNINIETPSIEFEVNNAKVLLKI